MAKIIWEGNQDWDRKHPEGTAPRNAVKISRPDDILKASAPYGIIPMIVCFACVFLKKNIAGEYLFDLRFMPLSFVIGFLMIPLHELLHAVCYPSDAEVYIGICLRRMAAYTTSFCPLSKRRYIVMSLMPMVLGLIPLAVFMITPPVHKTILTLTIVPSFMGMISPSPDYMDVHLVFTQVPHGARIQAADDGVYWFV